MIAASGSILYFNSYDFINGTNPLIEIRSVPSDEIERDFNKNKMADSGIVNGCFKISSMGIVCFGVYFFKRG